MGFKRILNQTQPILNYTVWFELIEKVENYLIIVEEPRDVSWWFWGTCSAVCFQSFSNVISVFSECYVRVSILRFYKLGIKKNSLSNFFAKIFVRLDITYDCQVFNIRISGKYTGCFHWNDAIIRTGCCKRQVG